jgi:hypothetical protein
VTKIWLAGILHDTLLYWGIKFKLKEKF